MIFDLDENYTKYSLNLLPSSGDNVKSTGPPYRRRHRAGCGLTSEFEKNLNVYFSVIISPI
jgi:hypothetical protein